MKLCVEFTRLNKAARICSPNHSCLEMDFYSSVHVLNVQMQNKLESYGKFVVELCLAVRVMRMTRV